jgi:hypothetical protein
MERVGYARGLVTGRDMSKRGLWEGFDAVTSVMMI